LAYNGVGSNFNYVVGSSAGYASYLRAANNTSTDQKIYATVQQDDGTVFTGPLGTIGANAGKLYTAADLNTATKSTLTDAGKRANVWLFGTGTSISFGNILANPTGDVVAIP
jgi:hypothetical protein